MMLVDKMQDHPAEEARRRAPMVDRDAGLGWPEGGTHDAVVVAAASPTVPALVRQLADRGRVIIPGGTRHGAQRLVRIRRAGPSLIEEDLGPVTFVPLVGDQGW